jgi:indolepyruvate ferredoxin oxidoreductase beta subunit
LNPSQSEVINIVFAGLGGQGVLTASGIAADAAFRSGLDVKKAEVHGMSQRGGFVTSDVRFGKRVLSPMVPPGEAAYLVVFEDSQMEASRWLLREGGQLISSASIAGIKLPHPKSFNVALLGVLSASLDLPERVWFDAIRANLPEKVHEANLRAFELGRNAAREQTK